TASICDRSTPGNQARNSSIDAPSRRFSNSAEIGTRVPRKTHAPLTLSGSRSTASQFSQMPIICPTLVSARWTSPLSRRNRTPGVPLSPRDSPHARRAWEHPLRPEAILCLFVPLEFTELDDLPIRKSPDMHLGECRGAAIALRLHGHERHDHILFGQD